MYNNENKVSSQEKLFQNFGKHTDYNTREFFNRITFHQLKSRNIINALYLQDFFEVE